MKKSGGYIKRILAILLCLALLTGCGTSGGDNQMPQINSKVAAAMEEDSQSTESTADGSEAETVEPLQAKNDIPADGVISKAQMETIAGQDMTVHFNGKTDNGITYQWSYDAKQIQNPIEQKLLVEVTSDGLDNIKKEAADAPYALAITLQPMQLAAAPTLTLTLNEQWDADRVLYCCEEDGLKKLSDVTVSTVERKDTETANAETATTDTKAESGAETASATQTVTVLSFTVPRVGDTFYLVGGSTTGADDSEESTNETDTTDTQSSTGKSSGSNNSSGKTSTKDTSSASSTDKAASSKTEETTEKALTCTISIDCKTILDNLDNLRASKADYVPADGWILYKSTVEFEQGDTVFDVLKRVTKAAGIQMESKWTPMYNSYYVEGINQLYEFDCGEQSGWMYSVNGWYPNYGCSSYELKDGDKIEWRYTCDLGSDVGDQYMGD